MGLDGITGSNNVGNQQNVEQQTDVAPKGGARSSTPPSGGESIGSIDSWKKSDPEGYNSMMQTMASGMIEDLQKHDDAIKEIYDKEEQDRQSQ